MSSSTIHDKTWKGDFWGPQGAIALQRKQVTVPMMKGELSALSSTLYAASGNALARFRSASLFAKPLWLWRAVWCLLNAWAISNNMEKKFGLKNLTADQLDVRARILFKCRRYKKALRVTKKALSRPNLSCDTMALLEMGHAEILIAKGNKTEAARIYWAIYKLAENNQLRPTTSVRVYRSYARFLQLTNMPNTAHDVATKALHVATVHKLDDQAAKI